MKNIYLQNLGIGRGMKVGKEAIYAAIIGVENWYKMDWTKEINNQNINFSNHHNYDMSSKISNQ